MSDAVSRETPPAPPAASGVFASRLPLAERYAGWLADAGVVDGSILLVTFRRRRPVR